jgi:predicted nucleotidyltransferase
MEGKMNAAIIAEYNPFHNGHLYHIQKTKEVTMADKVIAVMSGNFVQRGEPALLDKVARTRCALQNGIDMVLELPVEYATGAADVFAFGAVDLLNKTNIVDGLCFGTEAGNISDFSDIADILNDEPEQFKELIKQEMEKGITYPSARANALARYIDADVPFLSTPNNILALEYIRVLKRLHSKIWPYTIKRTANEFNSTELTGDISSATAIRTAFMNDDDDNAYKAIPENCHSIIRHNLEYIPTLNDYSGALHYILRTTTTAELTKYADVTEGIENRIKKNDINREISELINVIKTKRYTYTKLNRAILHILLKITRKQQDMTGGVKYIRVLGFRKESENLLAELTQKASVPVITNAKSSEDFLRTEARATDLYYMATTGETGKEFTNPIVVI